MPESFTAFTGYANTAHLWIVIEDEVQVDDPVEYREKEETADGEEHET